MRRLLLVLVFPLYFGHLVQTANVSWASPLAGAVYGPGDTILAQWKNDTDIASPSFRLCEANTTGLINGNVSCGSAVSPLVQKSAGSYFISVYTPNVTTEASFYLQMEYKNGKTTESPNFSLSPTPMSINPTSSLVNSTQLNPQLAPDLNANHVPLPTAAFAVPLSFLAAILLASVFLCFHHRRKLNEERALDIRRLSAAKEKQSFHLISPTASSHAPSVIYLSSSAGSDHRYSSKEAREDVYSPLYKLSSDPFRPTYSHTRRESAPRIPTRQAFPIPTTIVTAPTVRYKHSPYTAHPVLKTSGLIPSSRCNKVPASLFKAHKSPVIRHPLPPGLGEQREENRATNASVNHSVISNYLVASPIPPCLSPGMPAEPDKLHVRNGAVSLFDKPLPSSPRPRYSDQAAYDAVAQVVRSTRAP